MEELDKIKKIINGRISRLKDLKENINLVVREKIHTNKFLRSLSRQYMNADILIIKNNRILDLMTEYPRSIDCKITIPQTDEEGLNRWLKSKFYFDIDFDPESDTYENLYYNNDLRSFMGCLTETYYDWDTEINVHLLLTYYVKGFENYWFNIIENSDILERVQNGN